MLPKECGIIPYAVATGRALQEAIEILNKLHSLQHTSAARYHIAEFKSALRKAIKDIEMVDFLLEKAE